MTSASWPGQRHLKAIYSSLTSIARAANNFYEIEKFFRSDLVFHLVSQRVVMKRKVLALLLVALVCAGQAFANGIPSVTTASVTSIESFTAASGGNVTSEGAFTVTARGVCWNTTGAPTVSDAKTEDGSGLGAFTSSISGLAPLTTYYLRAYATNNSGTAYGSEETFTTSAAPVPSTPGFWLAVLALLLAGIGVLQRRRCVAAR